MPLFIKFIYISCDNMFYEKLRRLILITLGFCAVFFTAAVMMFSWRHTVNIEKAVDSRHRSYPAHEKSEQGQVHITGDVSRGFVITESGSIDLNIGFSIGNLPQTAGMRIDETLVYALPEHTGQMAYYNGSHDKYLIDSCAYFSFISFDSGFTDLDIHFNNVCGFTTKQPRLNI